MTAGIGPSAEGVLPWRRYQLQACREQLADARRVRDEADAQMARAAKNLAVAKDAAQAFDAGDFVHIVEKATGEHDAESVYQVISRDPNGLQYWRLVAEWPLEVNGEHFYSKFTLRTVRLTDCPPELVERVRDAREGN